MNLHIALATVAFTVATVGIADVANGENDNACTGLEAVVLHPKGKLPDSVVERIRVMARRMEMLSVPSGMECADLGKILSKLVNSGVQAGKKLEHDQPFNSAAAQAELDQALQQNPELKSQLDALRSAVTDDYERMLYEAALLQSNSLYGARDLRLQQFIQQVRGG